jgi:hypothetical protein
MSVFSGMSSEGPNSGSGEAGGGGKGHGFEFFGWSVPVLISASELEAVARPRKVEKDEVRSDALGT